MHRRDFIAACGGAAAGTAIIGAAAWTYVARTQRNRARGWLLLTLSLQAEAAAVRIRQFIEGLEAQLGWTTQPGWSASTIEQRRFDVIRLLRQAPAITEFTQLDSSGREQVNVSRLAVGTLPYVPDYSQHPKFTEAMAHHVYYGPVYFLRESEPYMTLSLAGAGRDAGVSAAEVNLRFIWDVVSQISVGPRGQAYIVDAEGRLIAHPDVSLVLRGTDMSRLPQVAAARAALTGGAGARRDSGVDKAGKDVRGRAVFAAYARIAPLGWLLFVERPAEEAATFAR